MSYPTRIHYTEKDKALMRDRWQKGESLHSIARHFGRTHSRELRLTWARLSIKVRVIRF